MPKITRNFIVSVSMLLIAVFLLAACSSAATASSKPVDVQVTLSDFGITSSLTTFTKGVPYHFVVTNKGAVAHEFMIMPVESGQVSPDQVQSQKLAGISGSDLPPGATKTLDYTFTQAAPQGTLEFACHLPGHYEAGMHTPITVQ
jgi:uncharacterized cupredoxin-like copper-binding protein